MWRLRRLRFSLWSTRTRWEALAALVVAIVVAALFIARYTSTSSLGALTLIVATSSLVVVATSNYTTGQRQRQQYTLDAWNKFSDGTLTSRQCLTNLFGRVKMSPETARALIVPDAPVVDMYGQTVDPVDADRARDALSDTLNGLERLAAGVKLGALDPRLLRAVGATPISKIYDRYESYMEERQKSVLTDAQGVAVVQETAFSNLVLLRADIKRTDRDRQLEELNRRKTELQRQKAEDDKKRRPNP